MEITEPQKDALQKIRDLMGEHFSSGIFVYEIVNPDDENQYVQSYTCYASFVSALGLIEFAKHTILKGDDE